MFDRDTGSDAHWQLRAWHIRDAGSILTNGLQIVGGLL